MLSWSFDLTWEYLMENSRNEAFTEGSLLAFLRPYPILAAVMDGDIPSRPSSL